MRNFIVAARGQVVGFDMLARWRVPHLEDVATFLLALRLLGPRVTTLGASHPNAVVAEWRTAFLEGYGEPTPPALPVFEALVLLDRWAALVTRPTRRGPVAKGLRRLEHRALEREADRVARVLA